MAIPLYLSQQGRMESFDNAVHAAFLKNPPLTGAKLLRECALMLEFSQDELLHHGEQFIFSRVAQLTREECRYCKHRTTHVQTNHSWNYKHIEVEAICNAPPEKCPTGLPSVSGTDKPTPVEGIEIGSW
jgi:hypothetical protein